MTEISHGTIEGTIIPAPSRYDDAITAVFMLRGAVRLWEAEGPAQTHNLYQYLLGGEPGERNPLGNLRQYRPFQSAVEDAAALLMVGGR